MDEHRTQADGREAASRGAGPPGEGEARRDDAALRGLASDSLEALRAFADAVDAFDPRVAEALGDRWTPFARARGRAAMALSEIERIRPGRPTAPRHTAPTAPPAGEARPRPDGSGICPRDRRAELKRAGRPVDPSDDAFFEAAVATHRACREGNYESVLLNGRPGALRMIVRNFGSAGGGADYDFLAHVCDAMAVRLQAAGIRHLFGLRVGS
jgi:hypothetical protein